MNLLTYKLSKIVIFIVNVTKNNVSFMNNKNHIYLLKTKKKYVPCGNNLFYPFDLWVKMVFGHLSFH